MMLHFPTKGSTFTILIACNSLSQLIGSTLALEYMRAGMTRECPSLTVNRLQRLQNMLLPLDPHH